MPEPETNEPVNTTAPTDAAKPAADAAKNPAVPGPEAAVSAELTAQLAAAKQEAATNLDRYVRSVADLENFRRRTVREKDELRLFASSKVLEDLLPVLDNLSFAITAAKQPNADAKSLASGVDMVATQLKSALTNHGLKEINPVGQAFDANLHESISAQPSAEVPEGNVLTVVRTGFSLNGRLLRPASVILSSGPAKAS
jgi:molecular chaperone GrpE